VFFFFFSSSYISEFPAVKASNAGPAVVVAFGRAAKLIGLSERSRSTPW
jgi:hypothetical protein